MILIVFNRLLGMEGVIAIIVAYYYEREGINKM